MNLLDMFSLGFTNLWRTRLRTFLTLLGVVIGIAALTSMVSFGTGMQKNVEDTFANNDLFTSMTVTSEEIDLEGMIHDAMEEDTVQKQSIPLNDSLIQVIREIDGVNTVFPEIRFVVKLELGEETSSTNVNALPASMGEFKPYNDLFAGKFFDNDSSNEVVIRWETLKRLKIITKDEDKPYTLSEKDSLDGVCILPVDSILGRKIKVISAVVNAPQIALGGLMNIGADNQPFKENISEYVICGILKKASSFSNDAYKGGIIIPMKTARAIPRTNFTSMWNFFSKKKKKGDYNSLYVRVEEIEDVKFVKKELEQIGVKVFSIGDQLKEIRRVFMIMDAILGAIGTIALIVASLGIINTMIMSILERTREIGVMKAIGGSEWEIRKIFFVEASAIGLVGAIFGLILGWMVSRVANYVVNTSLMPAGEEPVNLFYFPLWLVLGAIVFSVVVSLAAGLYPASRAARINPVEALRHD